MKRKFFMHFKKLNSDDESRIIVNVPFWVSVESQIEREKRELVEEEGGKWYLHNISRL